MKMSVTLSVLPLLFMGCAVIYVPGCSSPVKSHQCVQCHLYGIRLSVIETGANVRRMMEVVAQHKNVVRVYQNEFIRPVYEPVLSIEILFENLSATEVEQLRLRLLACPGVSEAVIWSNY